MGALKVRRFFQDNRRSLKLSLITGDVGLENLIETCEINRPGLFLAGYREHFNSSCVTLLTRLEGGFLQKLTSADRRERIIHLLQTNIPCIINSGAVLPKEFINLASLHKVAIIKSKLVSNLLFTRLSSYLEDFFSPEMSIHGVLLDVYGVGTLIMGKSGVGKSECALALVRRGHRLVADDIVDIKLEEGQVLMGGGPELIRHHMEIRGLGIINIRNIFGIGSVRTKKRIEMVVGMEAWKPRKEYDRLGLEERKITFLGVSLPEIVIPVRPGRDVATLVEVSAMNQRLKIMGSHSAKELTQKLSQSINLPTCSVEEE